ncbi:ABC transporter substrate-binding protein [Marinobacter sp. F3R08]|uniref:ABC transporter substrate-binding protein n=1 Tax=Marinobacter sp. F3R08 TaxID=2841559 RepID=UPI001C09E9E2|nr:ABC transporter substrate-binding protein [Marinobacter sp. F3R08]MBU2953517.1 ABC transporter substrate-binding protein [Marinobacter sp. F3R08]
MSIRKKTVTGALAGLLLAGCATGHTDKGPTVISYDHGALDTLIELGAGDRVLATPHRGLPDYLAQFGQSLPDSGSLKEPDLETIRDLSPDLVLMTGRQGDMIEEVKSLADVHELALAGGSYRDAVAAQVHDLANLYGRGQAADRALKSLWSYAEEQRSRLADAGTVTVVTHNDGRFSLRNEPVVVELLGLKSPDVPATVKPVTRGTRTFYPVTAEQLAVMAPDVLLVVDRSAAIGADAMADDALRSVQTEKVGTRVVRLDPALWYLSGGGLQSVRLQVDEVARALD